MRYYIEPRTRRYAKGYGWLSSARKYRKQLWQKELDATKKKVHKAGEYLGNKIADAATKSNNVNIEMQEPIEEISISQRKEKKYKQIEKIIIKIKHYKISKLLNDSTV